MMRTMQTIWRYFIKGVVFSIIWALLGLFLGVAGILIIGLEELANFSIGQITITAVAYIIFFFIAKGFIIEKLDDWIRALPIRAYKR